MLAASFPSSELGEGVDPWLDGCAELGDIEANFLPLDHPIREGWKGTRWEGQLAIQAPRAVIVSELHEVELVGPAIRVVERTLRLLEEQIGEMESWAREHPFEIRLFASREAMFEANEDPVREVPVWAAACQGESDNILRISLSEDDSTQRSTSLNHLMCSQVAFSYLECMFPQGSAKQKRARAHGVWVTRGIVGWASSRVNEILQGKTDLEQFRYPEVGMLCQIARERVRYQIESFFDATAEQFMAIDPGQPVGMRVRDSSRIYTDDALRAFSRQSAGLVYFSLYGGKRAGKKELMEYLKLYGDSETPTDGWTHFGYASAGELEREFQDFPLDLDRRFKLPALLLQMDQRFGEGAADVRVALGAA